MTEQALPKEEQGPRVFLPNNVDLTILYSTHNDREDVGDFGSFEQLLRTSDVYIPEALNWTPRDLNLFRQISQGNPGALNEANSLTARRPSAGFDRAINDALFRSHVRVVFADVPHGSEEGKRQMEILSLEYPRLFDGSLQDALSHLRDHYSRYIGMIRSRDDYILGKIGSVLTQEIQSSHKLRGKDRIQVLMTIGSDHRRVGDTLTETAQASRDSRGSDLPVVSSIEGRITDDFTSKIMRGIVTEEDIAEASAKRLVHITISNFLNELGIDVPYLEAVRAIDELTFSEIEGYFTFLKATYDKDYSTASRYYHQYTRILEKVTAQRQALPHAPGKLSM